MTARDVRTTADAPSRAYKRALAEPIGELKLKGISHPIAAVNVIGMSPAGSLVDA